MSSGQSYDVRHAEMALLNRTNMLVGVEPGEDDIPAGFRICPLLRVVAIEPLPTRNSAG